MPLSLEKLKAILDKFEITIAAAQDLTILEEYELVVIADDSTSMTLPAMPQGMRVVTQKSPSRWEEMKEAVMLMVEIGAYFDATGVDIFFLNRDSVKGVTSTDSNKEEGMRFHEAFEKPPKGSTPLTEAVQKVALESGNAEKPTLLFILTDGVPNGGPEKFLEELEALVKKKSTTYTFKVQIIACTGDDEAVGWLNGADHKLVEVDVTDDFESEKLEIAKMGRKLDKFTRADWLMKAMLGPVSAKFDKWDEPTPAERIYMLQHCRCEEGCKGCTVM